MKQISFFSGFDVYYGLCTVRFKSMNPRFTREHTYVLNEFVPAHNTFTSKFFEKTLIEIGNLHLHASFDNFYVQIGQVLEAQ